MAVTAFPAVGPAGAASLIIDGFQPVRSRWTWQPRLPELWLREHEGRQFREMIVGQPDKSLSGPAGRVTGQPVAR
jgi:hypothetical protein